LFGRHIRASSVSMGEIRKGRKQSRHKKKRDFRAFIHKKKKKENGDPVSFDVLKTCMKKFEFYFICFYFKLIFLMFLDHFDALISKIILKKIKNIILIHF